nr:MAG TPA: hypothetical protein [Caudoviricetes sp.]
MQPYSYFELKQECYNFASSRSDHLREADNEIGMRLIKSRSLDWSESLGRVLFLECLALWIEAIASQLSVLDGRSGLAIKPPEEPR